MAEVMNAFVERQNIVHYIKLLKTETDSAKRATVVRLLADEVAKHPRIADVRNLSSANAQNLPKITPILP